MQRYERLLGWALQVTDHDRARAEDLVHDIFIQFTLSQPDTGRLYNIDGYLYTMLRNMHLSQIRRATRLRDAAPSLADFDSAELGIRTVDPRNQIQVREELRLICQYACNRKHSSKAGSVLILRFFHGYYPGEIARILRTTCAAVDQWLRIARREVRLYLNDSDSLNFINATAETVISYPGHASSRTDDALAQLRDAILATNGTPCLAKEDLRQQFAPATPGTLDNKTLGHVVTCATCLDEVNRLLALPPLSERHPTDRIGPDRDVGGGDGPRGPAAGAAAFSKKSRRHRKDVIEHRPQELRIAVNGFVLGSQKVSSEVSELSLSISQTEKLGFIEVFSEQEVRMLFLSVEPPPDGQAEYKEQVELSDGRSIELALRFSETWPNVDVVYRDPSLAIAPFIDPELQAAVAEKSAVEGRGSSPTMREGAEVSTIKPRRRFSLAWSNLSRHLPNLKPGTWNLELLFRPATVTAILAALLLALVVFLARRAPTPLITANDLLARASAAEDVQLARNDQVLHHTISLEEKSSTGTLIARRRIEVWHSGERGVTARRLYDERGALVAGDWRRSDGVQTLYHHGTRPQLQLTPDKRGVAAIKFDNVWQLGPTAKEFASLIGSREAPRVEETPTTYVIDYPGGASTLESGIVKARLVLSRADLHAVEQTLVVEQESQAREYRFVETSFERRSTNSVAPAVFEPDAELLSSNKLETPNAKLETAPLAPSPVMATAALEVEVLRLLNQAGADLGEQISVTRAPDGRLNVHGVIETAQRKQEILDALRPVAGNPAVRIEINTVAEALRKQPPSSQRVTEVVVENAQPTANAIPVDAEVRRYLSVRGVSPSQMDDEVRRFANQMVSRSRQAMYHAAAMKRLAERFSPDEVRTLDDDARAKWLALIRQHARSFLNDSIALRQELAPVFSAAAAGGSGSGEIPDTDALIRGVTHLFEISAANYNSIQSAFTVSRGASTSSALKSAQFWRSMREAEMLAGKIASNK